LVDTEALARLLLRAEAIASSKIEGLEVGVRRLLRAGAAEELGERSTDVTAAEVLANIEAMSFAVRSVSVGSSVSPKLLLEVHRCLLSTGSRQYAGRLRTNQNWIGGSSFNPCSADFVPPPPERIQSLFEDLCNFCNLDNLPVLAQAAIAHAQFETIHPFADGNGRVGRTLNHVIMRRRGLLSRTLPPISLVLATLSKDYIRGLSGTRYAGQPDSESARNGIDQWLGIFAAACARAVVDAEIFERRIQNLGLQWRKRLGSVRGGSSVDLLLRTIPGSPILTVQSAAAQIQRSVQAVNEAIARLVRAGVLAPITAGRRHRAFEAKDLVVAFTDLERRLASPSGDTRVLRPARRVPHRRG
jgi:Fic family protein